MGWFNGFELFMFLGLGLSFLYLVKTVITICEDEEIERELAKEEKFKNLLNQSEGLWK